MGHPALAHRDWTTSGTTSATPTTRPP